jgi:hypothetical protein
MANAVSGLSGQNLTERRFLSELFNRAEAVRKPGLYVGFLGLLGAPRVDAGNMHAWLPEWRQAYTALAGNPAPIRLDPHRLLYYERAIDFMLSSQSVHNALWPLWHTWTHIICALPTESSHHSAWQKAGEQLGLLGDAFIEKIEGLDAYLDLVEELLETWARENGVQAQIS